MTPSPVYWLTAELLYHVGMCQRRVWLDGHQPMKADLPQSPPALFHTSPGYTPDSSWDAAALQTQTLIHERKNISGAVLDAQVKLRGEMIRLCVQVDLLVHDESTRAYRPVLIKNFSRPDAQDMLRMNLALLTLKCLNIAVLPGVFWLDTNERGMPSQEVRHFYDEESILILINRTLLLLDESDVPEVKLKKHCRSCHWLSECRVEADEMALLPGLRKDSLEALHLAGIKSLAHLADVPVAQLQKIRGIKSSAAGLQASARSLLHQTPVWLQSPPALLQRGGWMFDIETLQLPGGAVIPWCIGWSDESGAANVVVMSDGSETQRIALPDGSHVQLVPDVDSLWLAFYEAVKRDNRLLVHWSGYDAGILKSTAPQPVVDALLPRTHDLLVTVKSTVRLPIYSYSIKDVAPALGFNWSVYADWFAAFMDYQNWQRTQNLALLARACAYQRDDVLALSVVWRWLEKEQPRHLSE